MRPSPQRTIPPASAGGWLYASIAAHQRKSTVCGGHFHLWRPPLFTWEGCMIIAVLIFTFGLFWIIQNRDVAGPWVFMFFLLLFLFLLAGSLTPLDTLQRANDGLDRINTRMMRYNLEQSQ